MPLDSTAEGSNTPTSKGVIIRLESPTHRREGSEGGGDAVGSDDGHKSDAEPYHLS